MPNVTVHIAESGTKLKDGGRSLPGHMWYEITDSNGKSTSYGFAPDEEHEGRPWGPGQVYDSDSANYTTTAYSRTIEITQAQYDALKSFGDDPAAGGFDLYYRGLSNSCIDFTWKALEKAGLNPSGFEGKVLPTSNIERVKQIVAPAIGERPSARISDRTTTNGVVTTGDFFVLIGGAPAARRGDIVVDPLGVMSIVSFSQTVWIGSAEAARMGDLAAPNLSKVATGVPGVVAAPPKGFNLTTDAKDRPAEQALSEDNVVGPHIEGKVRDTDGDGQYDTGDFDAAAANILFKKEVDPYSGKPSAGGTFGMDLFSVKGHAHTVSPENGMGGSARAEGALAAGTIGGIVSDGDGSLLGLDATGRMFYAKAEVENWSGYNSDTGEYGIRQMGGAKASVLSGELHGNAQMPVISTLLPFVPPALARKVPFFGEFIMGVDATVGGDLVSAGGDAGYEATYNPKKRRVQLGVSGGVALLLGLKFDLKVYFERVPAKRATPKPGPVILATGELTVLIGD